MIIQFYRKLFLLTGKCTDDVQGYSQHHRENAVHYMCAKSARENLRKQSRAVYSDDYYDCDEHAPARLTASSKARNNVVRIFSVRPRLKLVWNVDELYQGNK